MNKRNLGWAGELGKLIKKYFNQNYFNISLKVKKNLFQMRSQRMKEHVGRRS